MVDESRSFIDRHFPAMVTLVIALSGGLFSLVQYKSNLATQKLERQRQQIEMNRINEQRTSEFRLQIASFVYNGRKEIFSKQIKQKTRMRDVMKATFPFDVYNDVFTEIAKSDPNERTFWIDAKNILVKEGNAAITEKESKITENKLNKEIKQENIGLNLKSDSSIANAIEAEKIIPHVRYKELPQKSKVTGANLYKFYFTVEARNPKDIKKVIYKFNHPSWGKNNVLESTNGSNNFEVTYDGWGAINSVDVTAAYNSGNTFNKAFDMITYLGW